MITLKRDNVVKQTESEVVALALESQGFVREGAAKKAAPENEAPAAEKELKEELAAEEPSLIISRRPCMLLKTVKHRPPLAVDPQKCIGCKSCMRVGCPAISIRDGKAVIDFTQCMGCSFCKQLCPKDAIGVKGGAQA